MPDKNTALPEVIKQTPDNPCECYLAELFASLVAYKSLPKYQFERRVDAILSIFLPELLLNLNGWQVDIVVPEFPIKKAANNQSTNVDYLLYRHSGGGGIDPAWVFFELKTDAGSVRDAQLDIYLSAMQRGMPQLQRELQQIAAASKAIGKYKKLTSRLLPYPQDSPIELVYLHPGDLPMRNCPEAVHLLSFRQLQTVDLERHGEVWDMFRRQVIPNLV